MTQDTEAMAEHGRDQQEKDTPSFSTVGQKFRDNRFWIVVFSLFILLYGMSMIVALVDYLSGNTTTVPISLDFSLLAFPITLLYVLLMLFDNTKVAHGLDQRYSKVVNRINIPMELTLGGVLLASGFLTYYSFSQLNLVE